MRNGVEGPAEFAAAGIVGHDSATGCINALVIGDRRPNNNDIVDDGWARISDNLTVKYLRCAGGHFDFAVVTKIGAGCAGFGVDGD